MPKDEAAEDYRRRRRTRQLMGTVLLLAVAGGILVWARFSGDYLRDVLINIGASVIIVALSYAIFDPIFEQIRQARVQEWPSFDDVTFCSDVARASREVRVMDTCNHILEGPGRLQFLRSLEVAAVQRATVQILLLDPDSAAAEQRAGEIRDDVRAAVVENLRHLQECRQRLAVGVRNRLQVRVYDALPSIQFFQYDSRALVSFFPAGGRASDSPHLELAIDTPLGGFVLGRFEELWGHSRTRTLDTWLEMEVSVWQGAQMLGRHALHYVRVEDCLCLDASPVRQLLVDYGRPQLRFEVESRRPAASEPRFWSFELIQDSSEPTLATVTTRLAEKYGGPDNADRLLIALRPENHELP